MLETENLQNQLHHIFSSSKDNQIDDKQKIIRPYIFETIQTLENNSKLCLSDLEIIDKIHNICQQNTKDLIQTRTVKTKRQKKSHLNSGLILSNIHARIIHDVELALEELKLEIPDPSINDEEDGDYDDDDDYYLDPNPKPIIVHH